MDFSGVTPEQYQVLAVLLLGMLVGKAMGMETRVLSGLLIISILSPDGFVVAGVGAIVVSIAAKGLSQWVSWL